MRLLDSLPNYKHKLNLAMSPQSLPFTSLFLLFETIKFDRPVYLHCHHFLIFHFLFNLCSLTSTPNIPMALLSLATNHLPKVMYFFHSSINRLPHCIWHSGLFLPVDKLYPLTFHNAIFSCLSDILFSASFIDSCLNFPLKMVMFPSIPSSVHFLFLSTHSYTIVYLKRYPF